MTLQTGLSKLLVTGIISLSMVSAVCALSTDRNQPAVIDADEVEFDFRTGQRTYKGNVHVSQGTLRITADKLLVSYHGEQLVRATAWGRPAHFRQRPDGKKEDVIGKGRTIILHEKTNTLTLINRASLKQGTSTANGEKIVYNMSTDKMTVKSATSVKKKTNADPAATSSTDNKAASSDDIGRTGGRSRVIIIPRSRTGH